MPWAEALEPVRMVRVAILAPGENLRDVVTELAGLGVVELEVSPESDTGEAARLLAQSAQGAAVAPALAPGPPQLHEWARAGRLDLVAGAAQLEQRLAAAVSRDRVAGVLGWVPATRLDVVAAALAAWGAAAVALPNPRGVDPPTLVHSVGRLNRSFAPLVDTYGTVPYADVDPTVLAAVAFVVMFGLMFGDAGHGAVLLIGGLLLRAGRLPRAARLRPAWPFVVGAGVAAIVCGFLFGEFFGPTGVLRPLWLKPLDSPLVLLEVAVGLGAVLLAGAYALGTVNRWREGGWRTALVAPTGVAGTVLFLGAGMVALGAFSTTGWLLTVGAVVAVGGLALAYAGLLAGSSGGASGATEAAVELFDGVVRLGTNVVSFARIAAFGLAHGALLAMVWQATTGLWAMGGAAVLAAVLVFVVGNVLTFVLEGVVAGVQALRLEYYELFSRVFVSEGRAFQPWSVPLSTEREP